MGTKIPTPVKRCKSGVVVGTALAGADDELVAIDLAFCEEGIVAEEEPGRVTITPRAARDLVEVLAFLLEAQTP